MLNNINYLKVFKSLPDLALLIDPKDDTIIDSNNAYLKKSGLSKKDIIGKKCYQVVHKRPSHCAGAQVKCPLKRTLKTHNPVKVEHLHYDKNNNPYYVEVVTSLIKGLNGRKIILHICHSGLPVKKFGKLVSDKGKRYISHLKNLAVKDQLTSAYNYRYLMERLPAEVYRSKRYSDPFSLLMLDIDYFKSVNDVYGHQAGDAILLEFSNFISKCLRQSDYFVRYGGEEFIALMPHTDKIGAQILANRLINKLAGHVFKIGGTGIKLRVSIGIATLSQDDSTDEYNKLLGAADKALQRAKDSGGNVTIAYSDLYKDKKVPLSKISTFEEVNILKRKIKRLSKSVDHVVLESIYAFSKSLEARDNYTAAHAEEMVSLVLNIGRELGLSKEMLNNLEKGAMLHDIGKIGISDSILRKKSKLTPEEYRVIKTHPKIGAEIIRAIHFLKDVVPIVLHHHERWDGLGYPSGLKQREIPLLARIVSIADAYQALTSDRPYRKAYTKKEALNILRNEGGSFYDKDLVAILERLETKYNNNRR